MSNPIEFSHTLLVSTPPQRVFDVLDDFSQTPKWLARCTGIEKLSAGDNAIGTKLRYAYSERGRIGTMDGSITARIVGQRLTCAYTDKLVDVVVDFQMAPAGTGTRLTHAISMTPKSLLIKLVAPLIRKGIPKQTIDAMEKLKVLLES